VVRRANFCAQAEVCALVANAMRLDGCQSSLARDRRGKVGRGPRLFGSLGAQRIWASHRVRVWVTSVGEPSLWRTIAIVALTCTACSDTALQCGQVNAAVTVSVSLGRFDDSGQRADRHMALGVTMFFVALASLLFSAQPRCGSRAARRAVDPRGQSSAARRRRAPWHAPSRRDPARRRRPRLSAHLWNAQGA
jgi:hypothetical protein